MEGRQTRLEDMTPLSCGGQDSAKLQTGQERQFRQWGQLCGSAEEAEALPGLKEQEEAGKTSTDGSGEPEKALRRDAIEGKQGEHAVLFCLHTHTHTLIHTLTHTHTPASFPSPESGKRYIIFF